jgi:hypothetical protein
MSAFRRASSVCRPGFSSISSLLNATGLSAAAGAIRKGGSPILSSTRDQILLCPSNPPENLTRLTVRRASPPKAIGAARHNRLHFALAITGGMPPCDN